MSMLRKVALVALVVGAVTLGAEGQQEAQALTISCTPHGCYQTPTVVCRTPVCTPTYYVCYYDPGCCRWITRWYKNQNQFVFACNVLRFGGYRYNAWVR